MSQPPLLSVLLILLAAAATGCSDSDEKQCTLIGCENGITLKFEAPDGQPINTFNGTIKLADKVIDVECDPEKDAHTATYSCHQNTIFLRGTDATDLHVNISSALSSSTFLEYFGDVKVAYEPLYPNGEQCDAACHQATKTLSMSAVVAVD